MTPVELLREFVWEADNAEKSYIAMYAGVDKCDPERERWKHRLWWMNEIANRCRKVLAEEELK